MKRLLHPLVFVIAVLIVFEEWLWDGLRRSVHRLSGLPAIASMERWLRSLGPWISIALLLLPAIILFPCKLAALWAMSHHHPLLGLIVLIGAKLLGTSMAAYLFDIVRDSARQLAWFDRFYLAVIRTLNCARAWLQRQPSCIAAGLAAARAKQRAAGLMRIFSTSARSRWHRKFIAAKVLAHALPSARKRRVCEPVSTMSEMQLSTPSANDFVEPDVWAIWPDGAMCTVGIDLCRALRQPNGRSSDYCLVHVIAYNRQGEPVEWVMRQSPLVPPISFSRLARRRP